MNKVTSIKIQIKGYQVSLIAYTYDGIAYLHEVNCYSKVFDPVKKTR